MTKKKKTAKNDITIIDKLTGAYNASLYKEQVHLFFNIAKRYKKIFTLVIVNVEDIKSISKDHGTEAGNLILKNFSDSARETLRKTDIVIRHSGNRFIFIMPEINYTQSCMAIGRLRENIKNKRIKLPKSKKVVKYSIKYGIASYDNKFANEDQLYELAAKRIQ